MASKQSPHIDQLKARNALTAESKIVFDCWEAAIDTVGGRHKTTDRQWRHITKMRTFGNIPRNPPVPWAYRYDVRLFLMADDTLIGETTAVAREPAEAVMPAMTELGLSRPDYGLPDVLCQHTPRLFQQFIDPTVTVWTYTFGAVLAVEVSDPQNRPPVTMAETRGASSPPPPSR